MPSEMKVNKISPASGTSTTLGDSGDTFTITSGVTLAGAGTSLTALNATQLTSGTVPTARLGSGTANSSVHLRGDGTWAAAGGGKVLQVVNTLVTAHITGTTSSARDASIPQITEGHEVMTLAITPASTSNKLLVHVIALGNASHTNRNMTMALFNTDVHATNAISVTGWLSENSNWEVTNPLVHYLTAPTTNATTFRVRLGSHTSGTSMINGFGSTQLYNGKAGSSITIWEIEA